MKRFTRSLKFAVLVCLTGFMVACASTSVNYAEKILGKWDTDVNGFPITVEISETEIGVVGFGQSIPYSLAENVISFDFQGPQVASIEFVSDDVMNQTNTATNVVQVFNRQKP